jgi:phage tail-like protein
MTGALPDTLGAASRRRYLRGHLPAVYSEVPNGEVAPVMGLLEGLEQVLDPLVILLDNLASHVEPATAPAEMLDLLMEMTGAPVDQTLSPKRRRALAAHTARIARARGTKAGLQLALGDALPELNPQVLDNGRVGWGPSEPTPDVAEAKPAPPDTAIAAFEVQLTREPTALERSQLARCIADHLPVGASYRYGFPGS